MTVSLREERRTLAEVVDALAAVDDAWRLAVALARAEHGLDVAVRREAALRRGRPDLTPNFARLSLTRVMTEAAGYERDRNRTTVEGWDPTVQLTKRSPVWIDLAAASVGAAAGAGAAWGIFAFIVRHPEQLTRYPHRLRTGWHLGQAEVDDAKTLAVIAETRRKLAELEMAQATDLAAMGETLTALGTAVLESNVEPRSPGRPLILDAVVDEDDDAVDQDEARARRDAQEHQSWPSTASGEMSDLEVDAEQGEEVREQRKPPGGVGRDEKKSERR